MVRIKHMPKNIECFKNCDYAFKMMCKSQVLKFLSELYLLRNVYFHCTMVHAKVNRSKINMSEKCHATDQHRKLFNYEIHFELHKESSLILLERQFYSKQRKQRKV